ncbi:MAG: ABC transporter permease [Phycisphaerales bacterium]|nr:ABC transporter permease [Phycisphaerales bacterium]
MKAIHIKLFRDIASLKGQAAAIGLVMACGVATFVMSLSLLDSLNGTLNTYYEQNRFAQVFAHLKRAPLNLNERIAQIPGVAHVQTRIVERITLDMPDLREPASGQIISLPPNPREGLNLLYLRAGRFPSGTRSREIMVSQRFAHSHRLEPGDSVQAIMNGRLETLRVVGIALSPEYIYLISPGSIFPDNKRYGIFWMARHEMEAAFDMKGAFNDVTLSLMPGTNESEVITRLDQLTEHYGGLGAYQRDDQLSHKFVANEIHGLRGMTIIVPIIFLGVAAFLLNIVIARIISTQREQIAVLKAMGYRNIEIGLHFYSFVMLITILAVIAGSLFGAWMGRSMTVLYTEYFDFPSLQYTLKPHVLLLGFLVSTASASLGVAHALRVAMRLPPAEAMRPQPPLSFRPTILERLGLHRIVPPPIRMILRQLERQPIKTGLSILGIALATAILVVGSFTQDAVDYFLDLQFNRIQQYDIDVVLAEQTNDTALSTIRHMPGVLAIEPYRSLAVRLRSGHIDRRTGVLGLTQSDGLFQLLSMDGRSITLPENGIILSTRLAEELHVRAGDSVTIDVLEGRRPSLSVQVSGLINDFSGLSAYMNLNRINKLMRQQHTIGGAFLLVDPAYVDALYEELHNTPRVAAVNVKSATEENFRKTIARNLGLVRPFLIGFSVIIAFSVIYNSARISLSERSRDLATLRVLGFTRREVSMIQLGELAILTTIAIPIGLALGHYLSWLTSKSSESELVRIPFIIEPSTFVQAAVIVALASVVSGLVVGRHLDKLDLISVLKSRE